MLPSISCLSIVQWIDIDCYVVWFCVLIRWQSTLSLPGSPTQVRRHSVNDLLMSIHTQAMHGDLSGSITKLDNKPLSKHKPRPSLGNIKGIDNPLPYADDSQAVTPSSVDAPLLFEDFNTLESNGAPKFNRLVTCSQTQLNHLLFWQYYYLRWSCWKNETRWDCALNHFLQRVGKLHQWVHISYAWPNILILYIQYDEFVWSYLSITLINYFDFYFVVLQCRSRQCKVSNESSQCSISWVLQTNKQPRAKSSPQQ